MTDCLCGGSHLKRKGDIPHFIVYWKYFLLVLMHSSQEELCSNSLPFPSSAQSPARFFYLCYWELAHITYLPWCQHSDL